MLRPTIYIAPKDLCLLTARWNAAEAAITQRETEPKSTWTAPYRGSVETEVTETVPTGGKPVLAR